MDEPNFCTVFCHPDTGELSIEYGGVMRNFAIDMARRYNISGCFEYVPGRSVAGYTTSRTRSHVTHHDSVSPVALTRVKRKFTQTSMSLATMLSPVSPTSTYSNSFSSMSVPGTYTDEESVDGDTLHCAAISPVADTDGHEDSVEALENNYITELHNLFDKLQQLACRDIAKRWVEVIEPQKRTEHPYEAGEAGKPTWWPAAVRHRQPAHLLKGERLDLLVHIITSQLECRDELHRQALTARYITMETSNVIEKIFDVVNKIPPPQETRKLPDPPVKATVQPLGIQVNVPPTFKRKYNHIETEDDVSHKLQRSRTAVIPHKLR